MKALVITKNNIDRKKGSVSAFLKLLDKKKISYEVVSFDEADEFFKKIHNKNYKNSFDVLISFGGDGTILKSARIARKLDIPILGINVGTMGFLTSVNSKNDIEKALDKLKKKEFMYDYRFMLDVKVLRDKKKIFNAYAVNETTITTSNICKMGKYSVCFEEKDNEFNEYRADGLIVASPTGSTAHSLSAGGPIVAPDANCLIVTAICPHAFNQRSVVVNADKDIYIKILNDGQLIDIDGRVEKNLEKGDIVHISKLKKIVRYIIFEKDTFFNNLKSKINNI